MIPTGRQTALRYGDLNAVVTELGATLRELSFRGRALVAGFAEDELPTGYRGAVLAPWPNRITDGHYTFAGLTQQLPLTEPDRRNALHGLVCHLPWQFHPLNAAAEVCTSARTGSARGCSCALRAGSTRI
jgi:aldose 1-epimerase